MATDPRGKRAMRLSNGRPASCQPWPGDPTIATEKKPRKTRHASPILAAKNGT